MGRAWLSRSTSKRHQFYLISGSLGAPRHAGNSVTRSVRRPIRVHRHPDRTREDRTPVAALAGLARRRALRNIGDRVGQGRRATSEPDPDVGTTSVHRLKDGDRFAFFHPLADQRRSLGADVAQLRAALAELRPRYFRTDWSAPGAARPRHQARRACTPYAGYSCSCPRSESRRQQWRWSVRPWR